MTHQVSFKRPALVSFITVTLLLCLAARIPAQRGGRGGGGGGAVSARQNAAIDLTGYWVSVITEDWKFRMVTPGKGMFEALTLNAEGRRVGEAWDPAKDEATGEACRSYGAAGIMRMPGRLHITWENDTTLRIDTDAGTQTRLFHFGGTPPQSGEPTWQGYSAAQWQYAAGGQRGSGARTGTLKVVTTHMRTGYLRKNGVPYSGNARLTEYYDRIEAPGGEQWLIVTTTVDDPQYLNSPFVTSTNFRKQPDAPGWNPTPCSAR